MSKMRSATSASPSSAATGEDDPRVQNALVARSLHFFVDEMANFLGPRLENVRKQLARENASLSSADARYFDGVFLGDHGRQTASVLLLDFFRFHDRSAQSHGDIVGEVIASGRKDRGMPDRALVEYREVGGATADIDERTR